MDKNKVIAAVISIAIGMLIGSILVQYVMTSQEQCTIIKQENQMLRDMLFNQQDPYRPDTTQQPKEVEGCEL
jgi:hypothetical protein